MPGLVVVDGAALSCMNCLSGPSPLIVTNGTLAIDGKLLATEKDHVVGENIDPFPGMCSFTFKPCDPQIPGPWVGSEVGHTSMSCFPAICESAMLFCSKGGWIKVLNPGQSKVSIEPPKKEEKEGFWGALWDDGWLMADIGFIAFDIVTVPSGEAGAAIAARRSIRSLAKLKRKPPLNDTKMNEHIKDSKEYADRLKRLKEKGKNPQTAWKTKNKRKAERLTRKAHKKGKVIKRHPPRNGEKVGAPEKIRHKRRRKVGENGEKEITVHCRAPHNGGECHGHPSGPKG